MSQNIHETATFIAKQRSGEYLTAKLELRIEYKPTARHWNTLETLHNVPVLRLMGSIYIKGEHGLICTSSGQVSDKVREMSPRSMQRLCDIWDSYHLNDLQAGTKTQVEALKEWKKENNISGYNYHRDCSYLKQEGLLTVNGYKYGSAWLYKPLPNEVITTVYAIFADNQP